MDAFDGLEPPWSLPVPSSGEKDQRTGGSTMTNTNISSASSPTSAPAPASLPPSPSPDATPVAVTGCTGVLGGMVARRLADAGVPQLLLARDPAKAPQLPLTTAAPFDFDDRDASIAALQSTQTLLMVSASENARRLEQHRTFVDAAIAAGVKHVVYTSFLGAAPDATFTLARDHFATEQYIRDSGLTFTFLRDSFYIDFMGALVGEDGVIRGPAGDGRLAPVARVDVAAVAAEVLQHPHLHTNTTYNLTGPQSLSMTEVAAILSEARGTEVTFQNETLEEAYASRAKWDAPDWMNDAWVSTYTAIAAGELGPVSGDVEAVTGKRPITLEEFLASS
jgi:NAD(P)H dehydrogenase (quinone)